MRLKHSLTQLRREKEQKIIVVEYRSNRVYKTKFEYNESQGVLLPLKGIKLKSEIELTSNRTRTELDLK